MSHEDGRPYTLRSRGWETLPDGRQQLLVVCETVVDYATMPKELLFGPSVLRKRGWDSDRKLAFYRTGEIEDMEGIITE